ncbi:MAG: hypothetical protein AAGE89_06895 [Pseudomonadota bacterium]
MTKTLENESLVLDLVEWIAKEPKPYDDVMDAWRTSCPRLSIWEDAVDHGFVARRREAGATYVEVTEAGETFLRAQGRI